MSQARVLGMIGVAALAAAAVAYAQTTVTPIPESEPVEAAPLTTTPEQVTWGDAEAGATKATTCAACHGVDGNPSDPQYPRLAGQNERYIAHQIALFKSGERNTGMAAVMKPFADALSAQDARDIGAYYANQKAGAGVADDSVIASGPNEGMKFYEVGEKLFLGGDSARGIPACMACHGPDGAGNPGPAYPQLAGQQAAYTQRRLEEYRAGVTQEQDPHLFNVMATVARSLSDEEIGALSSYLQGLHPRADDFAAADAPAAPLPTAPAPAEPSAPTEAVPAEPDTDAGGTAGT
ncbi:c-type cytochrome [Marilutibacter chinensis]|uniref:Cytochrome c4 n=1 Tax=Marilutibacter chinensis TaxID=2912247 RepID=A0ABS9HVP2_9GAMM|nr:c-type cytochrome [Lysobacter chinensis]MCF7222157.1 cytochrome c4 [Lysobacter chinensis]